MSTMKWKYLFLLQSAILCTYIVHQHFEKVHVVLKTVQLRLAPKYPPSKPLQWFNNNSNASQDDPNLIEIIRENFLYPPSNKKYDLTSSRVGSDAHKDPQYNPSAGQVQRLEGILRRLSPGFFVECGAMDGICASNTLWIEMQLGWEGLLIESHPLGFADMKTKNRKAWTSNLCLSIFPYPVNGTFYGNDQSTDLSGLSKSDAYGATKPYHVQCMPLFSILLALDRTTVEFFSLDVEGNELDILKTIPFDRIIFKVISIEHTFIPGGLKAVRQFMEDQGYIFYQTFTRNKLGKESNLDDVVFLHPTLELTEEERKLVGHEDPIRNILPRT